MEYITKSDKETKKIAKKLAEKFGSGVIALIGDLGSGKTTFTQGFAEGLGIKDKIISPTFIIMRQHPIPNRNKTLHHIDLYRLEDDQLNSFGLNDILNSEDIILIEWAEKAKDALPKDITTITFETIDENTRKITIT